MKRNVSLEEISDGKLYSANDLVRTDCGGCRGCSACCHGMGSSIVLDPLDAARLTAGLGMRMDEVLAAEYAALGVVDGIILPSLKMGSDGDGACAFLNVDGRCRIHSFRPGICRLFPLGRYYHDGRFSYFLQVHECPMPSKTKVRVRKWLDTPELPRYERFVTEWHYFLEKVQEKVETLQEDADIRNVNLYLLRLFYLKPWGPEDGFYEEFGERLAAAAEVLEIC